MNSGDTVSDIEVGAVNIEFQDIADYDTPANQSVTITKDTTATASGTYVHHVGSVSVTTDPASGSWRIVGSSSWNNSGATVSNIEVGSVDIEFQAIADHDTPANQTLTVTNGGLVTASGIYVQHTGDLMVITDPANGGWRLSGETAWRNSGDTVTDIIVGNAVVEFKEVDGYFTLLI